MARYYAKIVSSLLVVDADSEEEAEELYDKYFSDEMTEEEYNRVYLDDNYCDHEWEKEEDDPPQTV
jgi:hypothetical protein